MLPSPRSSPIELPFAVPYASFLLQPKLLPCSQQRDRFANALVARFRSLGHVNPHDVVTAMARCQFLEGLPGAGIRLQRLGDVRRQDRDDRAWRVRVGRRPGRDAGRCEQARRLEFRPPFAIDVRPLTGWLPRRYLDSISIVIEAFDETVNPSETESLADHLFKRN